MFILDIAPFMLMLLVFIVALLCAPRPPHPIFQSENPHAEPLVDVVEPEVDDEEDEDPPEELDRKRKRLEKSGAVDTTQEFSGTGKDFTAREKHFILQIWKNIEEFWKFENCIWTKPDLRSNPPRVRYRVRPASVHKFFEEITGVSHTTLSRLKEQVEKSDAENGPKGWVMNSKKTGSKKGGSPFALEAILPEMDGFIRDEIEKARKGQHLTVKILAENATKYFTLGNPIKPKRMKRCLNRLGFEYNDRKGVFVNRRHEPENLKRLQEFCQFVHDNVEQDPETGNYFYKIPIAFGDGANEYTKSFRPRSWMLRGHPTLGTCEKPRKKDQGQRVNMLGAIYSNSFDMNSFTAWNSEETDRNAYAKHEDIVDHTVQHVLPNLPSGTGAVYVLDNASNNKKLDDQLKNMKSDNLHDWINEHDLDPVRFQTYWSQQSKDTDSETTLKKTLMKYIREHIDEFTELAHILRETDVELRYLPKYYPECNPIELVWAHIKQAYKATDPKLPWRTRLDRAHAGVTEEQVEKCFDRSIRYCLDRLAELKAKNDVHGGGDVLIGDDDDNEEWMHEDDDQ